MATFDLSSQKGIRKNREYAMTFLLNGFGTTFYGKRAFESDGSYVTTKWIAIAYFPGVEFIK